VTSLAGAVIIETGSNANGEFIKFADGTMFCFGIVTAALVTSSSIGSIYFNSVAALTHPAEFTSISSVEMSNTTTQAGMVFGATARSVSFTNYTLRAYGVTNTSSCSTWFYSAIGRWKE
jgi:hypothetical protein